MDPILLRSKWLGVQRVLFVEAVVKYEKLVSKFYISTVAKLHFSIVFLIWCELVFVENTSVRFKLTIA